MIVDKNSNSATSAAKAEEAKIEKPSNDTTDLDEDALMANRSKLMKKKGSRHCSTQQNRFLFRIWFQDLLRFSQRSKAPRPTRRLKQEKLSELGIHLPLMARVQVKKRLQFMTELSKAMGIRPNLIHICLLLFLI